MKLADFLPQPLPADAEFYPALVAAAEAYLRVGALSLLDWAVQEPVERRAWLEAADKLEMDRAVLAAVAFHDPKRLAEGTEDPQARTRRLLTRWAQRAASQEARAP